MLVEGALEALKRHTASLKEVGVRLTQSHVVWVPGAFELPLAAATAAKRLRPELIVAVGCLIKGQTPQYMAIGHAVINGLCDVSVRTGVPVGLGVIIADSVAQAKERAGGDRGNRGADAVQAAVEMVRVLSVIR